MDLNYTPYNIVSPSCVMAPGAPAEIEPEEDEAPSAYVVRVSAELDNCRNVYIDARNEAESWAECGLIGPFGCMRLKTRETCHGTVAAWSGDSVGVDWHPELEALCDRAKAAVERYFKGKSADWWRRIRSSVLRSPGLGTLLSVRLPRRKGYIVRARVELVEPSR